MEVKIGVQNAARELSVDTDASPDTVLETLNTALKDDSLFTITDSKGHTVAVPADKVAYLSFNAEGGRKVGFGLTNA